MKYISTYRAGFLSVIFSTIVGAVVFLVLTDIGRESGLSRTDTRSSYQKSVEHWRNEFQADPDRAYADFVTIGNTLSYDDAHQLSHIIGEVLYQKFGMSGIVRCTVDFAFGCYHGFAGSALTARGLSAAIDLRDACNAAGDKTVSFGCIHGIGHGILAYLGNEQIAKALETCSPINQGEPIGGCYGGVFMEYNYNTMQSPTGIALRPYIAAAAYEPCATEIPSQFREACFYEQPSWWTATFGDVGASEVVKYRKAGELCSDIHTTLYRDACFRGIGNVIGPESGLQPARVRQWCAAMPDVSSRDLCVHEALQHLLQTSAGKAQLHALCTSGEISYSNICSSI